MFEYLRRFREHFPGRKFFQLIDKIYDMDNLKDAWKKVKSNKGCAGVDKQSIKDFQKQNKHYLREIQRAIKNGVYKATPVLRKFIPKGDGRFRPLGIPTVKDRILQQAVKNVIEPIFEMKFLDCSYGYRPDKSAHLAVELIKEFIKQGYTWVIDADVEKFFDSVDHELMMSFVAEEISDGKVLGLIESWLKAGIMNQGEVEETVEGTPQGGVVSPLLANIYLHEMDKRIYQKEDVRLVRYADDIVILCKSKEIAERTMKQLKMILLELNLQLNHTKTKIVDVVAEDFEFLGFVFKVIAGRMLISPSKKSVRRFKETVRLLTHRKTPVKPGIMVGRLNRAIRGWGNYFKIGNVKTMFCRLDQWIRTRVRTFIEKKKSRWATLRISNYVLQSKYKLTSLTSLIKPHSLQ